MVTMNESLSAGPPDLLANRSASRSGLAMSQAGLRTHYVRETLLDPWRDGFGAASASHLRNHVIDDGAVLMLGTEHDDLRISVNLHIMP